MKFAFYTLGCKTNQYETQAMERLLLEKGNVIPLYHSTRSWSLSEKYTGLFGDGLGRYFFAGIHAVSK